MSTCCISSSCRHRSWCRHQEWCHHLSCCWETTSNFPSIHSDLWKVQTNLLHNYLKKNCQDVLWGLDLYFKLFIQQQFKFLLGGGPSLSVWVCLSWTACILLTLNKKKYWTSVSRASSSDGGWWGWGWGVQSRHEPRRSAQREAHISRLQCYWMGLIMASIRRNAFMEPFFWQPAPEDRNYSDWYKKKMTKTMPRAMFSWTSCLHYR